MTDQQKINSLITSEQDENLELAKMLLIGTGLTESDANQKVYGFSLKLFFRLITSVLFSSKTQLDYQKDLFYTPKIQCVDGFNVSLQINWGNYCSSENGYRQLGYNFDYVEFGFPSENEELLHQYSEMWSDEFVDFDVTGTVGSVPIDVIQEVIDKHGGVNWIKTLSIESMKSSFPRKL